MDEMTDLEPGDRVRCNDVWNGTVIRTYETWLGSFVVVDYDHDQGRWPVPRADVRPL